MANEVCSKCHKPIEREEDLVWFGTPTRFGVPFGSYMYPRPWHRSCMPTSALQFRIPKTVSVVAVSAIFLAVLLPAVLLLLEGAPLGTVAFFLIPLVIFILAVVRVYRAKRTLK